MGKGNTGKSEKGNAQSLKPKKDKSKYDKNKDKNKQKKDEKNKAEELKRKQQAQKAEQKDQKKKQKEESSSESSDESSSEEKPKAPAAKPAAKPAKKDESSSESSDESSSEEKPKAPAAKPAAKAAAKPAAKPAKEESSSDESSDESSSAKAGAKKEESSDSSDESSSSEAEGGDAMEVEKPAAGNKRKGDAAADSNGSFKQAKSEEEGATFTVFVKNLPWSATEESLQQHFSTAGDIIGVRIATDRETGRSKGFGYVDFAAKEGMEKAIAELQGSEMDGRALTLDQAQPRTGGGGGGFGGGRGGRGDFGGGRGGRGGFGGGGFGGGEEGAKSKTQVFVKNLSWNTTEDALRDFFGDCGDVTSVRIMTFPDSGKPKGTAYIDFSDGSAQAKAVEKSNQELDGRNISVEQALERTGGGGGFRGRGDRGGGFGGGGFRGRGDRGGGFRGRGDRGGGFRGRGDRGGGFRGRGGFNRPPPVVPSGKKTTFDE